MSKLALKIIILVVLVGFFATASLFFSIKEYAQPQPIFYIILALIAIFIFFSGIAIGKRFASPVRQILEKAEELSKGNLSSRIDLETRDELSDLAKIINKIAEDLRTSHDQVVDAEKSLGIKVQVRTQELQETINALEQKVKNRTIEVERLLKELEKSTDAVKNKKT